MPDREALLFANEAFYQAFCDRDMDAMAEVWLDHEDVACIHPGWGPIIGHDHVIQSWSAILSNPESPPIQCRAADVMIHGDVGIVICFEEIQGQFLLATNVFRRDGSIWRLVHHQAGPTSEAPEPEAEDEPETRH